MNFAFVRDEASLAPQGEMTIYCRLPLPTYGSKARRTLVNRGS